MISGLCTLALAFYEATGKDYTALFSAWKTEHKKTYASGVLEAKAFTNFVNSEMKITDHNSLLGRSFSLGHNAFSDMHPDDFYQHYLGYNPQLSSLTATQTRPLHKVDPLKDIPESVDWVEKGAVTDVKNQGQCGSCWSFSTTGALEGALAVATGKLVSLSEEELVQCNNKTDNGCQGGLMDNAFDWVAANGIATEDSYPYTSGTGIRGMCKSTGGSVMKITGHVDVKSGDEAALKSAVAQQPVSIAIEADKSAFQLYKSGVLSSPFCGTNLDHGVLLVGYGKDTGLFGKEFWKVKNSWGSTWGEDGYIRMEYGKNMCGIAEQPSYPTGAKKL